MVEKAVSSDKNGKEAFWETALPCVNATHRVPLFFSVISLLTLFSWNLAWHTSQGYAACGEKGNLLRWKRERSFLRDCFLICHFISQSYTTMSCNRLLARSLWILRSGISYSWKGLRTKEISSEKTPNEAFWETALWCLNRFHSVTPLFHGGVCQHRFSGISEVTSWISWNPMLNHELASDKSAEKPSQKLLGCGWIQLPEFPHGFHWEAC